jgi:D-beta-D-heptose 7-phosphate kinase/D-beta-D-heptose 1-phosphate adenosyltransferase
MEKTSLVAGGAANVAANLIGLGAKTKLFGIRGEDAEGEALEKVLNEAGITDHLITAIANRKTSIKTRIVAHSQHVVRIDQETSSKISDLDAGRIAERCAAEMQNCDAVIISDYAKGLLVDPLLRSIIEIGGALNKPVLVDPKGRDFAKYRGAAVITPNKREAADAAGFDIGSESVVADAGKHLTESLDLQALLITEGEDGMTLFERGHAVAKLPSLARKVYDVTGAGDTVIATFAAAVAAGAAFTEAARLANAAAGLVVASVGTTRIESSLLAQFLADHEMPNGTLAVQSPDSQQ